MGRITEAGLRRIKQEISLVELCRWRGMRLKPKPDGRDELTGRCPFHRDRDSSFVVIAGKNLFYCTHCRAGGGVLDFVVEAQGCDYHVAAETLLAALPDIRKAACRKPVFAGNSGVVRKGAGHAANP